MIAVIPLASRAELETCARCHARRAQVWGDYTPGRPLADTHLISLLDEHLLDVPSSDRHTVKPWFSGKLEFAPRVLDLADAGFPLAGGRLDVIEGRRVAALVYRADHHIINLFVRPGARRDGSDAGTFEGYGYERWREGDLEYWAVSDVDRPRLATFAQTWRARAGGA